MTNSIRFLYGLSLTHVSIMQEVRKGSQALTQAPVLEKNVFPFYKKSSDLVMFGLFVDPPCVGSFFYVEIGKSQAIVAGLEGGFVVRSPLSIACGFPTPRVVARLSAKVARGVLLRVVQSFWPSPTISHPKNGHTVGGNRCSRGRLGASPSLQFQFAASRSWAVAGLVAIA